MSEVQHVNITSQAYIPEVKSVNKTHHRVMLLKSESESESCSGSGFGSGSGSGSESESEAESVSESESESEYLHIWCLCPGSWMHDPCQVFVFLQTFIIGCY